MKKFKKVFAVILSLAMILGMSLTTFAAPQNDDKVPRSTDTVDVTITNLKDEATVTLYKIVDASYGSEGKGLKSYDPVSGVDLDKLKDNPSSTTITDIANRLMLADGSEGKITASAIITNGNVTTDSTDKDGKQLYKYTANVSAGVYIAIINQTADGTVYNPILLTAAYAPTADTDEDVALNQFIGGTVDVENTYMAGETAVAKSTPPTFTKEMNGTKTDPDNTDVETAGVGDIITYTLNPTVPSYPSNATNRTFYITDTMTSGLTFDYSSLTITLNNEVKVSKSSDGNSFVRDDTNEVIAEAINNTTGFNLAFKYNALLIKDANGATLTPTVTYSARVNEDAVVGGNGNNNNATMYYANQPNSGQNWDNPNDVPPQNAVGINHADASKKFYTYRLAFRKSDDNEANPAYLSGAIFGIFEDDGDNNDANDTMVDIVTTNEKGYAESTNVKAGNYYLKELVAPDGYSLDETKHSISATWDTVTTEESSEMTERQYTSVQNESRDGKQVGWLKNNTFYAMDEFNGTEDGVLPAYIVTEQTTQTNRTEVKTNSAGAGVNFLSTNIKNTKLANLPSTGGIGTTIFTIGGCAIMIIAAALFFASRKKSAK